MTYFIHNFAILQTFIELKALFTVGKKSPAPPLQECELPCDPTVIGLRHSQCRYWSNQLVFRNVCWLCKYFLLGFVFNKWICHYNTTLIRRIITTCWVFLSDHPDRVKMKLFPVKLTITFTFWLRFPKHIPISTISSHFRRKRGLKTLPTTFSLF